MSLSGWDTKAWIEVSKKLDLDLPPVAVGFSVKPPVGVKQMEDNIALCEMLKRAQEGKARYMAPENHDCDAGLVLIGKSAPSVFESGEFGAGIQVVNHYRAMRRIYDILPRLDPGSNINYIAFSPLDQLAFEPDLLVVVAETDQAEILLRAMSYSTGKVWTSKTTSVMGCAWIYAYPYVTGELNYVATGMSHGMKRRKVLPPGKLLISIPYELFGTMLHNLETMPWVLPLFRSDAEEFRKNLAVELGLGADRYSVK
jgi:uncharacterized protein (DUF169 family)